MKQAIIGFLTGIFTVLVINKSLFGSYINKNYKANDRYMSTFIRLYIYIITLVIMSILINTLKNPYLAILCLLVYFIILWFLLCWKTLNSKWICNECNKTINISFFKNMLSFFSFQNKIYCRKFYCDQCKEKNLFRCILNDKSK